MNDQELRELFEAHREAPDIAAKQRAIRAAMQVYDEAAEKKSGFFQGFIERVRLKKRTHTHEKENPMKTSLSSWLFGGASSALVGSACVGVFAFLLIQYKPEDRSSDQEFRLPELTTHDQKSSESMSPSVSDALVLEEPVVAERGNIAAEYDAYGSSAPEQESSIEELRSQGASIRTAKLKREAVGLAPTLKPQAPLDFYPAQAQNQYRDDFESVDINPIQRVAESPVSTFSIDVDTASYSFVRRVLNQGHLPNANAVRIEEMINYFDYQYPLPASQSEPFSSAVSVLPSPWHEGRKLVHIGIKGYELSRASLPKSNLVFLLDVSGSMNSADKLPLVKQSMNMLLSSLNPDDTIAIVVYAGAAGTVLEPTKVQDKQTILSALNRLQAGGSTAGAQGIQLAYQLAEANFDKDAVNRIILATDGDFNVGITDREQLKQFVENKRENGVYLSVLGFGQGNYHDHLMQTLAQNGNGVAAYIDSLGEAQKVLVDEATSTLFPIAKDVKIQLEFNPATVSEYRLIGYETRALKREDFNNDKVDAGDIGAGHTVTAIYEITPVGSAAQASDPLRYGQNKSSPTGGDEYGFLKLRYKLPDQEKSQLITTAVRAEDTQFAPDSTLEQELNFSIAVAGFAQLLKDDRYLKDWSFEDALKLAQANRGADPFGYRAEFVSLIRKAQVASALQ
jgi:Ca-activated chloride channel family protein